MCEGYWDRRLNRWVSMEEVEDEGLETLTDVTVAIPPPAAEPKRRPGVLLR